MDSTDEIVWVWIGTHVEYDSFVAEISSARGERVKDRDFPPTNFLRKFFNEDFKTSWDKKVGFILLFLAPFLFVPPTYLALLVYCCVVGFYLLTLSWFGHDSYIEMGVVIFILAACSAGMLSMLHDVQEHQHRREQRQMMLQKTPKPMP